MTPVSGSFCGGTGIGDEQDCAASDNAAVVVVSGAPWFVAVEALPSSGLAHSTSTTPPTSTSAPVATPTKTRLPLPLMYFLIVIVTSGVSNWRRARRRQHSHRRTENRL